MYLQNKKEECERIKWNYMKKVMIVDDSALMRKVESDIINTEPDLKVSGLAPNGSLAVKLLEEGTQFDLIILDINMPKMDGLSFMKYMNERGIKIPTIMVSSIASKSAKETVLALEYGAFDFVRKPSGGSLDSLDEFQKTLREKVHCVFASEEKLNTNIKIQPNQVVAKKPRVNNGKVDMIFVASSTGGPMALQKVLPLFTPDLQCPIVVVQHMPAGFTKSLADRLDELCDCKVLEAEDGMKLQNGTIYIAKGGYQMYLKKQGADYVLSVQKDEAVNGLRPCADVFLESLKSLPIKRMNCAVLTGMGSDGTKGLSMLKDKIDIYTVVQSQSTCVVYGMPGAAVRGGVADEIVDLQQVATTVLKNM